MTASIVDLPNASVAEIKTEKSSDIQKSDVNHEEHQYLDLIREILETGEHRPDR
jgi:thymidylate synthase